jgi:hypothetical protein
MPLGTLCRSVLAIRLLGDHRLIVEKGPRTVIARRERVYEAVIQSSIHMAHVSENAAMKVRHTSSMRAPTDDPEFKRVSNKNEEHQNLCLNSMSKPSTL